MVWLPPVFASGSGLTDTTLLLLWMHPVAVIVSVRIYVVVTVGLTLGLDEVEVNPDGIETHE